MAKKTAFDDLFSDDFGKLGLQRLEELNAMALTLKENLKASAQTLSAKVRGASPSTASGAKEIENTKKEVEDLKKQSEALAKIQERLNKATSDAAKEQAQYNLELKRQNQLNRENAILESEKSTQYEKNVVLLNRLSKQIMALGGTDKAPKELADEFNRLFGEVKNAEESVKRFQRNVGNYASATAELKDLTKQLIDLELAGQRDSAAFREMQKRAAELKDTISDTKAEISNMASDTKTIDGLVGSVNLLANGFQVFEGVMALTGETSEEWKETMVKLQAIMAVTSGIQEIQNALQKESAAMMFLTNARTKALAVTQTIYTAVTGRATAATTGFKIALASTGIGLIVVALGAIVSAMDLFSDSSEEATENIKKLNDALDKNNTQLLTHQSRMQDLNKDYKAVLETQKKLIDAEYSKSINDINTEFAEQLETLKELKDEEEESLSRRDRAEKSFEKIKKGYEEGVYTLARLKQSEGNLERAREDYAEAQSDRLFFESNELLEYAIKEKGIEQKKIQDLEYLDAKFKKDEEIRSKEAQEKEKKRLDERFRIIKEYYSDQLDQLKEYEKKRRELLAYEQEASKKDADVRNQLDQEKRRGLIDGYKEQKEAFVNAKKEEFDLAKTATKIEFEARGNALKKQAEFELNNAELTANERELIQEKLKNDLANLEREKQSELTAIQTAEEAKRLEKEKQDFERRKQFAQQALQFMEKISEETAKAKLDAIDKEVSASEERESQLKTLAQQGQLNAQQSIALEEKRQAELESKREKALKRQREQAIILAGIEAFIASARAGSTNPSGDAGNQVNGLLSNLEGALNKIKAFEKGGLVDGGEQLVRINEKGEEFVVKHDAVNKYGEQMLYDINEGRFNPLDYVSTPSMNSVNYSEPIATVVVSELREVKEAIRTKPVPSWSVSEITKGVREDIREGNNLLRKHYERGNKLF